MSSHDSMLRSLKGIVLGPPDEKRIAVDSSYLDAIAVEIDSVLREVRPDTAVSVTRWESMYALSGAGSDDTRRSRVLLAYKERAGDLSVSSFVAIAAELGYEVEIEGGEIYPFRADISRCDIDPVRDVNGGIDGFPYPEGGKFPDPPGWAEMYPGHLYPADFWIWVVRILSRGSNDDDALLRETFEMLKRADTIIHWQTGEDMAKSKQLALPTPTQGDNVSLYYARNTATITGIRAVLSGAAGGTVRFDIYKATARNAGTTGTRLTTQTIVLSDYDDGVEIGLATPALAGGEYLYMVISSIEGSPTFLEIYLSYTGGD